MKTTWVITKYRCRDVQKDWHTDCSYFVFSDYSSLASPKKGGFIKSRKRKRKEDSPQKDAGAYHHTYVIKMFDRSVDLAPFCESTPLYPICRAWMKNDPQNQPNYMRNSRTPTPDPETFANEDIKDEKKPRQIYHLPPPDPIPLVSGLKKDLRIPEPLPPQKDDISLDVYIHDETAAPQKDVMLLNHVNRWKEVRSRWKAAALKNEARFSRSAVILKSLFDQ
ncbi:Protein lin-37 [Nymphon striatum]|nr:Protein lin-37 [Nymphon striatum]